MDNKQLRLIECPGLGDAVAADVLCSPIFSAGDQGYSAKQQVAVELGSFFPQTNQSIIQRHVARKFEEYCGKIKAATFH